MTGVQTCALPICFPVTICFEENPKHVFIVSFDESGEGSVWASGDLSRMGDAALLLTMRATQNAMGAVIEDL